MVTVITVNITNFNNHYHVVILKIVSITMFCSDVHYTVLTVYITEAIYTQIVSSIYIIS